MSVLGRLLYGRRAGEERSAWLRANLQAAAPIVLTSEEFHDGGRLPQESAGRRVGGADRSPQLSWNPLPPAAVRILLVVEDLDVPFPVPAVHCLALLDPSASDGLISGVPAGVLTRSESVPPGIRLLRSTVGRGYRGPEPIKGHGPHRYMFQLFALADADIAPGGKALDRSRPRAALHTLSSPVLARGRLTGTYER